MDSIIQRIQHLKAKRDAVILAHYYVDGAVQDLADYVGDSYYLSQVARSASQSVILFCGVRFMAESAKILSPEKTVIMPEISADCPMAHMVSNNTIEQIQSIHDDLAVVCYINSTTETKAISDVCVTSSNAKRVISGLSQRNILFVPDKNLGGYLSGFFPEKTFILPEGFCPIHDRITTEDVLKIAVLHPDAKILTHPECSSEVVAISDFVGSTSEIIHEAAASDADTFIICTEEGVKHQLRKDNSSKTFLFPSATPICADMKTITVESVLRALETMADPISIEENLRKRAMGALLKMHEIAG